MDGSRFKGTLRTAGRRGGGGERPRNARYAMTCRLPAPHASRGVPEGQRPPGRCSPLTTRRFPQLGHACARRRLGSRPYQGGEYLRGEPGRLRASTRSDEHGPLACQAARPPSLSARSPIRSPRSPLQVQGGLPGPNPPMAHALLRGAHCTDEVIAYRGSGPLCAAPVRRCVVPPEVEPTRAPGATDGSPWG